MLAKDLKPGDIILELDYEDSWGIVIDWNLIPDPIKVTYYKQNLNNELDLIALLIDAPDCPLIIGYEDISFVSLEDIPINTNNGRLFLEFYNKYNDMTKFIPGFIKNIEENMRNET